MTAKRICIVLTTRGNLAKMESTLTAITAHQDLALQVVIGGALLDPSFGDRVDGKIFRIDERLNYTTDDKTLRGIAESAGRCTIEMSRVLAKLKPDILIVIADRFEALAIAQAAVCQNVIIAHVEGGEVSGSIDEPIRHAISKLANLHFPANEEAAERLRRMGEHAGNIHVVGTPSLDLLHNININDKEALTEALEIQGRGPRVDLEQRYIVVSQHPVATEYLKLTQQIEETLQAVKNIALPAVWILPNDEVGSPEFARRIGRLNEDKSYPPVRYLSNLKFADYAVLVRHACCLIGNTSSGIRESAFLGVPVVNIGSRQNGRMRGTNVVDVDFNAKAIVTAARQQAAKQRYPRDTLYGDGHSGKKIALVLAQHKPVLGKTIAY